MLSQNGGDVSSQSRHWCETVRALWTRACNIQTFSCIHKIGVNNTITAANYSSPIFQNVSYNKIAPQMSA